MPAPDNDPALFALPTINLFVPVVILPDENVNVPVIVSSTKVPPRVIPVELLMIRLLNVVAEDPVMDCKDPLLFKVTVPLLCVNVLLLVKSPATFNVPEVEVRVPALIVSAPSVAVPPPKLRVPAPTLVKSKPPEIPALPRAILPFVPILLALPSVMGPV